MNNINVYLHWVARYPRHFSISPIFAPAHIALRARLVSSTPAEQAHSMAQHGWLGLESSSKEHT